MSERDPTATANADDDDPFADARTTGAVADRLASQFPDVAVTRIAEVLTECLAATRNAKVQNFRLVLAERETRRRLRTRRTVEPPGPARAVSRLDDLVPEEDGVIGSIDLTHPGAPGHQVTTLPPSGSRAFVVAGHRPLAAHGPTNDPICNHHEGDI